MLHTYSKITESWEFIVIGQFCIGLYKEVLIADRIKRQSIKNIITLLNIKVFFLFQILIIPVDLMI